MGPEWVSILALVALFVIGTVLPINMGALAYVAAWLVGMYALDLDEKEILAGVSGDLDPHPDRGHLSVRDRQEQRHRRPDRAKCGQGGRRPGGADPVGDVRRDRAAHRHRRRQPGGLRDHRPDRPRLRRPLQDQRADDGHDGRPRRPGRRLLADQHLRHDHQLGDGGRRPARRARSSVFLVQPRRQPRSWP